MYLSIDAVRSVTLALTVAVLVCLSGFGSEAQAASAIGSPSWLQSAQQGLGRPVLGTPTVPGAGGPATTPAFEVANSALIVNGNQTATEVDFQTSGLYPLSLVRTYGRGGGTLFGVWGTNLDVRLAFTPSSSGSGTPSAITTIRADGAQFSYAWNGTDYRSSSPDADSWIVRNGSGSTQTFTLLFKSGAAETYTSGGLVTSMLDPTGIGLSFSYTTTVPQQLLTVTHSNGQTIRFGYTGSNISSVTDPAGNVYRYSYVGTPGRLASISYPDGTSRTYTYASATFYLTSISVNGALYRTFSYNSNTTAAQNGLVDGSIQSTTFSYGTNSTTLTNAAGAATTYTYTTIQNQSRLAQVAQSGVTNTPDSTIRYSYDTFGRPISFTDARGVSTTFQYSADGLLLDRIAGNDPNNPGQQRETRYTWDNIRNRPSTVQILGPGASPIARIAYTYYLSGTPAHDRLQSVVVANLSANGAFQSQTTNYSYQFHPNGLPSQVVIDGPGGAVTRNYDTIGNLSSVVDALGNATTYSGYNGLGLPASATDPNGYTVNYGYDSRGRVISVSRTLDGVSATTRFGYTSLGQLGVITYPDNSTLIYAYDAAGRRISASGETHAFSNPDSSSSTYTQEEYVYNSLSAVTSASGRSHSRNCALIDTVTRCTRAC